MSSAINHKKRSRRGYKMKRTHLAPKSSPLISQYRKNSRRVFGATMAKLFRRMSGKQEG